MLSKREAKMNDRDHSMVTLSSPRRLLLRPALPERGHRQLPSDQTSVHRGILDVFCACPMVRLAPFGTSNRRAPNGRRGRRARDGQANR